ncbi:hypothetical protein ACNKHU_20015 [Shigella flexneri]
MAKIKHGLLGMKGTETSADVAKAFNLDVQRGAFVSQCSRVWLGESGRQSGR